VLKWLVGREVQLGRLAVGGVACLDGLLVVRLSAWSWSGARFGRLAFGRAVCLDGGLVVDLSEAGVQAVHLVGWLEVRLSA